MFNPRSLVYALYTHWDTVEVLVRHSREFAAFTSEQALSAIAKVAPHLDAQEQGAVLRSLVNADVLQTMPRSSDLQLNAYVLEFVRSLTREHELGLAKVMQARVAAIREATEGLNEGMKMSDLDQVRWSVNKLSELFRQISLQLDQDRHAIFELAETAKTSDSAMPLMQRYRRVLDAFDLYVEPMNQMMDTGPEGIFYNHLEEAERALDLASEQLAIQGALYSHRMQLRHVAHQAKELRRFGRLVAQQCADTLLPLREDLRQHNALSTAVSALLGQVRKRGLKRALARKAVELPLPVWRKERGFKLHLGDEVRGIMAAAQNYVSQSISFPQNEVVAPEHLLELVDEPGIRKHLQSSLPVESLLDWLQTNYGHLQDGTLLRLFHDFQHEANWLCEPDETSRTTNLGAIRVLHHPHKISSIS